MIIDLDETNYWLELLIKSNLLDYAVVQSILQESNELCKILNSIVKTTKKYTIDS
ncbi:four helix bundle protein [uncultured Clostridium sp.]|uniref:four helix bundle protein n=1 Tax=uncultured Clostridium sp. TaxID=59620 RepID=UPI003457E07B